MGVRRAVDMVLDLQRSSTSLPIVTYGPLIHNPQTLEILESRGICQVDSIEQIELGTAVIRAHGISPRERRLLEEKGVGIIDATCPRVSRVQALIRKHAAKGHFCVIVGDEDHPEVRGLMGFASAGGATINSADKDRTVEAIPLGREICVVAQTTQEVKTFNDVVETLKENWPTVHVYDTICDSTRKRQSEVVGMADQVDLMVVVGGKGSGNTRRLAKVAEAQGVKSLHLETDEDIPLEALAGIGHVGVTAGASTPNWQIRRVIDKLRKIGSSSRPDPLAKLRSAFDVTVMTYLWAAAAGGGLAATCLILQGRPVTWLPLAMTMLFVFAMHLLNRIQDRSGAVRFNTPEIAAFYARHRGMLTVIGCLASIGAVYLSYRISVLTCVLLVAIMVLGSAYATALSARAGLPRLKGRSLRDLAGSKTPLVALGWATAAAVLPVVGDTPLDSVPGLMVSFVFAAGMVFWRTALSDVLDIQGDRIVGRDTIPILVGVKTTQKMLRWLLVLLGLLLATSVQTKLIPPVGLLLVATILAYGIIYVIYSRSQLVDRLAFEGLVDGNLVLAGVISAVYGAT